MDHQEVQDFSHEELRRRFHRHEQEQDQRGKFYQTRQMLNVLFILLAISGIALWLSYSREMAAYILIAAVGFKFIELSLRIMKL